MQEWLPASVAPLGGQYQGHMREALARRWIDVYENPGKRSGAYSAPVYGVHPYMLLNYNDTLDAVFTLAHEMGHSMHTILSNAHQPFVYSAYTIFIAEVPSTLSEALFLEYMLAHATDDRERIVLLQHAIDGIVGTFYTQVLFADYELQAHRLVEEGRPVTADGLSEIYFNLLQAYYGDAMDYDELSRITWSRIPHFYSTPYYVYQYATCFASSAQLMKQLTTGSDAERAAAIDRYLTLLKSGGSDHPMPLLQRRGRRSQQAGDRPRRRRSAGQAGDAARRRDRQALVASLGLTRFRAGGYAVSKALQPRGRFFGTCSRLWVAPMQASMTTISPPALARAAASSFTMPVCSQSAFAPMVTASSAIPGVSSARRKTSTISIRSGTSSSDGYERSPRTSVSRGLTGITR